MVFLFKDKSIVNILFLLLLSIGVHFHFFFSTPVMLLNTNDGLLAVLMQDYFSTINSNLLFVIYMIALLIQAIRLNFLFNEIKLFQQSNYTVAMTYVLLSGLFTTWCYITPALLINFLLIWLVIKLVQLYNQPNPKEVLFNIGLLLGVSTIAYHPIALMIIITAFALAILRPFKLQEWFVLIMGILVPYYFLGGWLFITDHFNHFLFYLPNIHFEVPVLIFNKSVIISLSVILLGFLAGFIYWQQFNSRLVIQIRKNWAVLLVMSIFLITAPFAFKGAGIQACFICLVPFSAIISNAFSYPRRPIFPNLLFWLMIIAIVYNNWQLVKN